MILIMKKYIAVWIALLAILNISCEKEDAKGGWFVHGVYILQNDELVQAHDHTIEIPSEEGSIELQLVAEEITQIWILNKSDAISVECLTDCSSEDAVVYDYLTLSGDGRYWKVPRYIQTIRISADANNGKRSRTMKFRLTTTSAIPECADMTVRQNGK